MGLFNFLRSQSEKSQKDSNREKGLSDDIGKLEQQIKKLKAQSAMIASAQPGLIVLLDNGEYKVTLPSRDGKSVIVKDHTTARILEESERAISVNEQRLSSSS